MADDSPGKVQALRAIFSEKKNPVMGLMPPNGNIPSRPWCSLDTSAIQESSNIEEKKLSELRIENNRVLPMQDKKCPSYKGDAHKDINSCGDKPFRLPPKPTVGPKPSRLVQQQRTMSAISSESVNFNGVVQNGDRTRPRPTSEELPSHTKSKAFGETIASFMFNNNKENGHGSITTENESCVLTSTAPPPLPPVPKPRISHPQNSPQNHIDIMNFCNAQNNPKYKLDSQCCNIISSDNYICKSNCRMRRKVLPSHHKLGPAPVKPTKPAHMLLPPTKNSSRPPISIDLDMPQSLPPPLEPPPILAQRPAALQRPSYPCPPRPVTSPPLPPVQAPVIKPNLSCLREEIEELYEDTLCSDRKRPVSLIPEYTEEEEIAELYHDAGDCSEENSSVSDSPYKYNKYPNSNTPSEYLQPNSSGSNEELYQDANGAINEEFYEVMPCDEIPNDAGFPLYSNNKREIEKLRKEEEKRIRKEQKEKEKKEREVEKLRKKFGLTGDEIPIDDGLVKWDSKGGKGDLSVKKGETVLILRMEGNPSGRWLVKNEKGKIGYVELTNIEVDPLSVKSVMSIRRLSVISNGEELYCEAKSEEEAIYEVTY